MYQEKFLRPIFKEKNVFPFPNDFCKMKLHEDKTTSSTGFFFKKNED